MSEAEGSLLTERQRYWLEHVQTCTASGKTVAEYAAEHGLAAQAMYACAIIYERQRNRILYSAYSDENAVVARPLGDGLYQVDSSLP